ncbi:hypothetical protein NDU88_003909 [Pleurodeles waltl]|uniref:Uncharacterized protein n=1 Tax=Pleurodeles waltl TaxID=8319 RepID=A0AAV7WQR7_PLEWA|nr:hypothetical protein NDU88_003909 [Pleurodeles waltl]
MFTPSYDTFLPRRASPLGKFRQPLAVAASEKSWGPGAALYSPLHITVSLPREPYCNNSVGSALEAEVRALPARYSGSSSVLITR